MPHPTGRFACALLVSLTFAAPRLAAAAPCDQLSTLNLGEGASIVSAASTASGAFTPPGGRGGAARPIENLPAFCRVQGLLKPTPSSAIHFEVWLPESGWNGRLQVVGNGGLAGTIGYPAMATALRAGFATASTDTGHTSTEPPTWLQDRERLIDYSSRGLHLTTVEAKTIVKAFYSEAAKYAYYTGCSTGGKQGLMEAQRFPDDFDGILAGDAANFWTHQMASEVWNGVVTSSPDTNLPKDKLQIVQDAALAKCDALDGAKDGLVSDPMRCRFDPEVLQCRGADTSNCLTAAQVEAVRHLYLGPQNPRTKQRVYPGFYPGGEMGWASGVVINRTTTSGVSSNDFWAYALFHKPDWAFRTYNFDTDLARADQELAPITNATDSKLDAFNRLGHKLIYYHGAADPLIPAQNGIDYYESVVKTTGGLDKTQPFFRAFLVPGLYHCTGGPGPTSFLDESLRALQQWVEAGTAPSSILATKYVDGDAKKGVAFQRPLCPYPQVAIYNGSGDVNAAASFACTVPK
jgi:feruloyl esterase